MRFALAIVISCTACKGLLGLEEGVVANNDGAVGDAMDDAPLDDAMVDGMLDASGACYGTAPFVVCPGETTGLTPLFGTLNTSLVQTCDFIDTSNGRDWCVIARTDIFILNGISVTGSRPLVLLARNELVVGLAGMIDGSSRTPSTTGPGANHSACTSGNGMAGVQAGAGGAGGSFGSVGGNGGKGSTLGVDGGVGQPIMTSDALRGGCKGGKGAPGTSNVGGDGGGALYLLAGGQVRIDGLVNTSGAGGMGGRMPGTGGGGGGGGVGRVRVFATTQSLATGAISPSPS